MATQLPLQLIWSFRPSTLSNGRALSPARFLSGPDQACRLRSPQVSAFASLIESLRWTAVVTLPTIMELDRIASNANPLGDAAKAAVVFVVSHVRSHADLLKVQTSHSNHQTSQCLRS